MRHVNVWYTTAQLYSLTVEQSYSQDPRYRSGFRLIWEFEFYIPTYMYPLLYMYPWGYIQMRPGPEIEKEGIETKPPA